MQVGAPVIFHLERLLQTSEKATCAALKSSPREF